MGLNEAPVVPGFADVLGGADGFAVTGAFACAASSCEASGGPDEPQSGETSTTTGLTCIALTAPAIEAGAGPDDPMRPRLHQVETASDRDGSQYCYVCDVLLNGPEQYAEHLLKPKHRKELQKTYAGENCEQSPFPI